MITAVRASWRRCGTYITSHLKGREYQTAVVFVGMEATIPRNFTGRKDQVFRYAECGWRNKTRIPKGMCIPDFLTELRDVGNYISQSANGGEPAISTTFWEEPVSPSPEMHPKPSGKCSPRRPQAFAGLTSLPSLGH